MIAPLGFVVCGAPLASRAPEVARDLVAKGWPLTVGVTAASSEWVDGAALSEAATASAAAHQRSRDKQRPSGRPDRVVAFPLTFNTANKIASGVMDNGVTGTLCDALGTGAPILAAMFVNNRLWGHPTWATTLDRLAAAGVLFLDPHTGRVGEPVPVRSGTGGEVVEAFDPAWVVEAVASLPTADS